MAGSNCLLLRSVLTWMFAEVLDTPLHIAKFLSKDLLSLLQNRYSAVFFQLTAQKMSKNVQENFS